MKGRATPVDIFTPIRAVSSYATFDLAECHADAFAAYAARDWAGATAEWAKIERSVPRLAKYANRMIARSQELSARDPGLDWDGAWQFDEK